MVPCSRSSSAAASVTEEPRRPDPPHHTHTHGHRLCPRRRTAAGLGEAGVRKAGLSPKGCF